MQPRILVLVSSSSMPGCAILIPYNLSNDMSFTVINYLVLNFLHAVVGSVGLFSIDPYASYKNWYRKGIHFMVHLYLMSHDVAHNMWIGCFGCSAHTDTTSLMHCPRMAYCMMLVLPGCVCLLGKCHTSSISTLQASARIQR